jgi:Glutathione-dependent formaldehyde-activating enzyme
MCHCVDCQRRTGSVFSIAAFFERGAVSVAQGVSKTFTRDSAVGKLVTFHFLPRVRVNAVLGAGADAAPDRRRRRRIRRPLFPAAGTIRLDKRQARLA